MKKLLILLFGLLLAGSAFAVPLGQGLGEVFSTYVEMQSTLEVKDTATFTGLASVNSLEATTSIDGPLNNYSIDVVQVSNSGIVDNDTDTATFAFVPSIISITWTGRCHKSASVQAGIANGDALITITGTNTMEINANGISYYDDNGTPNAVNVFNDTSRIIYVRGGNDASTGGELWANATWETSTKTLHIKYQEANSQTGINAVRFCLTAYK